MARRPGPALSRADVVAAARACLEAGGEAEVSLQKVAAALGIKPPSLYNHVANQADLHAALVLDGWQALAARFDSVFAEASTPEARLRGLADAYVGFAREHPALYGLMSRIRLDDEGEALAVGTRLMGMFGEALGAYGVEGDRLIHAVRSLRASLHGFVALELAGQFGWPQSIEASYTWMMDTWIRALLEAAREA